MKFKKYLKEGLLHSDFTIGFELEAFSSSDFTDKDVLKSISSINPMWKNGNIMRDSSLTPTDERDYTFEYGSPVLQFNINNFKEINKLFESLYDINIYTNSTCGLHFHMAFPKVDIKDMFWLTSNLSLNQEMTKKLLMFNKFKFFNKDYASPKFLSEIKKLINLYKNKDELLKSTDGELELQEWNKLFSTEKYRILRVHPQGTLEWRGPRNFLESNNKKDIKQFLFLLWDFVSYFIKVMNTKELNGINRKDFDDFFMKLDTKSFKPNLDLFIKDYTVEKMKFEINKNDDFVFKSGVWYDGIWKDGIWEDGTWYDGTWIKGVWVRGKIHSEVYDELVTSYINPNKFREVEELNLPYEEFLKELSKVARDHFQKMIKKSKGIGNDDPDDDKK